MRRSSGSISHVVLMRVIGAPEDAAEHLFEHDERGVDENRFHLAREHDQGRQAARCVETRDIAGDEDGNFSCDRRVPRAMNALLAVSSNAEFTHGMQSFDQGDEISLAWRFRPFPRPCERRAIFVVGNDEQGFQSNNRLRRQAFNEVLMGTLAGKSARRQGDLLQGHGGGKQNASLAQMFDHRGHNDVATIRARCLFDRDMSNGALVITAKRTNIEIGLKLAKMRSTGLLPVRVFLDRLGLVSELRRDESQHVGRRRFINFDDSTRVPQIGEMDSEPEPIGGTTSLADQRHVLGRECVVSHDRCWVRRWIEQRRARLRREDMT